MLGFGGSKLRGSGVVGSASLPLLAIAACKGFDRFSNLRLDHLRRWASLHRFDGFFHLETFRARKGIARCLQDFPGGLQHCISLVANFDQVALFAVVIGVRFGILAHPLNFRVAKAGGGGQGNVLAATGASVAAP